MSKRQYDAIFIGGGLSASLAAYRIRQIRPEHRLLVLERGRTLGAAHVWSFHQTDITPDQLDWVAPFVVRTWPCQAVRFPGLKRRLMTPYSSITSERLHSVAMRSLGESVRTGVEVTDAEADTVTLKTGERITAHCVIDCRGALQDPSLDIGFQKFVGHEIETPKPHGVIDPVIMDATVPQHDGYRFVYILPFDERRLLIEDTYYSDDSRLNADELGGRVAAYQESHGWEGAHDVRKERGVLPIALGGDIDKFWRNRREEGACAFAGLRAALFHPTTGYSLPDAVSVADLLARTPQLETANVRGLIETRSRNLWRDRKFFRTLNRMMFLGAEPHERWRILERFYRLPSDLIERFYGDRLTILDKARILMGRPPVPIARALQALPEASLRRGRALRRQNGELVS